MSFIVSRKKTILRPELSGPIKPTTQEKTEPVGLGDAVSKVAQPIAKVIDLIAGTNIQNCGACEQRRQKLNEIVPNIRKAKQ